MATLLLTTSAGHGGGSCVQLVPFNRMQLRLVTKGAPAICWHSHKLTQLKLARDADLWRNCTSAGELFQREAFDRHVCFGGQEWHHQPCSTHTWPGGSEPAVLTPLPSPALTRWDRMALMGFSVLLFSLLPPHGQSNKEKGRSFLSLLPSLSAVHRIAQYS